MEKHLKIAGYCGLLLWMPVFACGEIGQLVPNADSSLDRPTEDPAESSLDQPQGPLVETQGVEENGDTGVESDDQETGEAGEIGETGESGDEEQTSPEDGPLVEFDFECLKIDRVRGPRVIRPAGLSINFRVTDCDGDPAPVLSENDFFIINDEKAQPFGLGLEGGGISQLGVPSSYALYSLLALDMSESIFRTESVDDVIAGALTYLEQIDQANQPASHSGIVHEVAVVAFGRPDAFEVIHDFSGDREQLREAIRGLASGESRGSTDLYGTYSKGLELLRDRGAQFELTEKFFVVFSDGTHEAGNEEALREMALEVRDSSETNIYSIGIEGNYDSEKLRELASAPANFLHVSDAGELGHAFRKVAGRVEAIASSNYSVGICTPVALGEPSLTIRVGMNQKNGELTQVEVTLPYSVAALDGDVGACVPSSMVAGKLSCVTAEDFDKDGQNDEVCEPACLDMQCGCDLGVVCGSCGIEQVCSSDFQCVNADQSSVIVQDQSCESETGGGTPDGIRLIGIRANQGVAVPLMQDGTIIAPDQRSAPIILGRQMMIQAAWEVEENWNSRELRADLVLLRSDEISEVLSDVHEVQAVSAVDDYERSFSWVLGPELVVEDLRYRIEMREVDDALPQSRVTEISSGDPFPSNYELGIVSGRNVLELVLVPVTHQSGSCAKTPSAMVDLAQRYSQFLMATYPLREANVQVRSTPITYEGELNGDGWIQLLGSLSQLRSQDGALEQQFYHGVIDPCGATSGIAGIGYVPPNPSAQSMAPYRTSLGVVSDWTMAHELGHNMGRKHVACSGREANPDGQFPYSGGKIGVWGMDFRQGLPTSDFQANLQRVDPQHNDFMSYCSDKWISDYGWTFAHNTIVGMESWSAISESRSSLSRTSGQDLKIALMGIVQENGRSQWWTEFVRDSEAGDWAMQSNGPKLQLLSRDQVVSEVETQYVALSDDSSVAVRAHVPPNLHSVTHFAYQPRDLSRPHFAAESPVMVPKAAFKLPIRVVSQITQMLVP